MVTFKEHSHQLVAGTGDEALVHNLAPRHIDPDLTHLLHGHQ